MVEPLPKCLMQRYSLPWIKFKDNEIMVSIILSEMRKAGWLERLDPKDARKRLYKLKALETTIREIAKGGK